MPISVSSTSATVPATDEHSHALQAPTATLQSGSPQVPLSRRWHRYSHHAARCLFGAMFFVFGLNGFLNFIPPPSGPMPAGAVAFGGALMQTGYMFPLIKGTEMLAGALLLANRFVPLALTVLAPIVINIFAFHAFLAPAELGVASGMLLLEAYLAWAYRGAFRPMLSARNDIALGGPR